MVVTFLIWLNISIHSLIWGDFFTALLKKLTLSDRAEDDAADNHFITLFVGVVFIALFAQVFHFFHRFDIYAQAALTFISLIFSLLRFKKLKKILTEVFIQIKKQQIGFLFGAALLFFSLLVLSADSPSFYDTDLYHAQTVKWAEQYPVVVGLGNLYSGFALNSSVFTLHALFSFHYFSGQSMHAVSGLMVVWLALYCYALSFGVNTSARLHSVVRAFTSLLLLFLIFCPLFSELTASLAPDITANIFGFLALVLVLNTKLAKTTSSVHLFKILLFAIFAVSAKLSMIFMLALPLLYWRFYSGNWRNFFISFSIATIILIPYIIKTALLSGYLLYPFYWLDVLHVDWKMSHQDIYEEMMWIRSWNRSPGENFVVTMKRSIFEWIPIWFNHLTIEDKIFVTLLPVTIFLTVVNGFFTTRQNFFLIHKSNLSFYLFLAVGSAIWFFGSPDPRFGYAFFITLIILLLVRVTQHVMQMRDPSLKFFSQKSPRFYQAMYLLCCFLIVGIFFGKKTHQDKLISVLKENVIYARDYEQYEMLSETRNGLTFYYTAKEDRMGYAAPLPSTPFWSNQFSLRGTDIANGFKDGL